MLAALAKGEKDAAVLANLAAPQLRARPEELMDALSAAPTVGEGHRQILRLFLERVELLERQMAFLERSIAAALGEHQETVLRLAAVPGLGIDSAQQVIAEVGPQAAAFDTPQQLASWVGVCPGREESAEVSSSDRTPKGNRAMRRVLNQVANAACKAKGSIFQAMYRRLVPRLGHNKTIWAVAHRLCRLVWIILHRGVVYVEYGARPDPRTAQRHAARMIRALRSLGYQITPPPSEAR